MQQPSLQVRYANITKNSLCGGCAHAYDFGMQNSSTRRGVLTETLLSFITLPLALAFLKPHGWVYFVLWVAVLLSWRILKKTHLHYDLNKDWNAGALNAATLKSMFLRFLPFAALMLAFAWVFIPDRLFSLPRERPLTWVMVMILYPLLSVVPQEFLFRSYFFKRFSLLIPNPLHMKLASALAFGWVHIVLHNWVAVVFSAIGGYLFADTYHKTKSLAAACLEHALYGCYIFTIGMGFYFYHGIAVR